MAPAIAYDRKYFFFRLVTAYPLAEKVDWRGIRECFVMNR
jgi:hypothetical protein